jgi:hypothetical protein
VLAKYGGKCQCPGCGITQYEWLAIDHVRGGGCRERREKKFANSQAFYNYLDKHPKSAKYQILCHNCNSAKAFYGGCPHAKMAAPIPVTVTYTGKIEMQPAPHIFMSAQTDMPALRLN